MNEEKTTTKFEEEPKHFALYGASESGRDYNTVDMSRLRMYNEYLAPYRAAVDAGAGSIMSSFERSRCACFAGGYGYGYGFLWFPEYVGRVYSGRKSGRRTD